MQQISNPLSGVGFVFTHKNDTPLQSADCGASAPKPRSRTGFAMWSCTNLADHKNTNCLNYQEVV